MREVEGSPRETPDSKSGIRRGGGGRLWTRAIGRKFGQAVRSGRGGAGRSGVSAATLPDWREDAERSLSLT